jgi:hypothetical protein
MTETPAGSFPNVERGTNKTRKQAYVALEICLTLVFRQPFCLVPVGTLRIIALTDLTPQDLTVRSRR